MKKLIISLLGLGLVTTHAFALAQNTSTPSVYFPQTIQVTADPNDPNSSWDHHVEISPSVFPGNLVVRGDGIIFDGTAPMTLTFDHAATADYNSATYSAGPAEVVVYFSQEINPDLSSPSWVKVPGNSPYDYECGSYGNPQGCPYTVSN